MSITLSIIVPVYNAEKYLRQCLDSILNQSFQDFEVLLIDDGSKDGSGKICDEYVARDRRIKVFHQQNQGASTARNVGITHAQGEWIYFVDADDSLKVDALEYMTSLINEQTSYVMCGFDEYDENGMQKFMVEPIQHTIDVEQAIMEMFVPTGYYWQGFLWCKLFKSSIIRKNNLKFNTQITFNEDRLFSVEYLCHSVGKVAFSTIPVYNYSIHSSGLTASLSSKFNPLFITDLDAYVEIGNVLRKSTKSQILMDAYAMSMCASATRFYGMCRTFGELTIKRIWEVENRLVKGIGMTKYMRYRMSIVNRKINKTFMKEKKYIKSILKQISPRFIKRYKSDIRKMQNYNNSSLVQAMINPNVYRPNLALDACADYVHLFDKIVSQIRIDVKSKYVYPLDSWVLRRQRLNTWDLVSMTVDYQTVLNSSLSDITKLLEKGQDKAFCANENRIIAAIHHLVNRIQNNLKKESTARSRQLSQYFERILDNKPVTLDEALQKMLPKAHIYDAEEVLANVSLAQWFRTVGFDFAGIL